MLTVRQLLKLPALRGLKLVSGEEGLDHVISSVNIMDNPDALDWFSPGEMLVTSGYFFKDSEERQKEVMKQLKNLNCPALCIKPKRYFGTVPDCILELGNKYKMPIIEIPYGMSFAKISTFVLAETSENYDVINKKSLEIHEEFLRISLHSGGLKKICQSLSSMIGNSVILMDKYWNVLLWEFQEEDPHPVTEFLPLEMSKSFVDDEFIRTLPMDFESLQKPLVRSTTLHDVEIPFVLMPVSIGVQHHGYILVWNTLKELQDVDFIALENAAMSFALERIRNNELERTKNRVRRDFFDELLSGQIKDVENLTYLCEVHGLNPSLSYTPMILSVSLESEYSLENLLERKREEDEKVKETLRFIEDYASQKDYVLHAFSQNTQIILLLGKKAKEDHSISYMKSLGEELLTDAEMYIKSVQLTLGIGKTAKNLLDLHKSFREAKEALRLLKKSPTEKKISHFEDFIVHHFLEENIDPKEMTQFFQHTLGPIQEYDEKYKSELLPTLESWIAHHFNVAETARALFAHRNTILYRMDRISTILQSDLKDSDEILKYQLALKIYRLLDL